MVTMNRGMTIGKLKTGISKFPLPDFEEIAESNVKSADRPMANKRATKANRVKLISGPPNRKLKKNKLMAANTTAISTFSSNLEIITAMGETV